ncbi:MAG: ankyrin repeat domain-containing protein [Kiritimatiellae bacterium]|nr:ankyrin repeat domain-containing protein [Kiritimatiellia bacterium]
MYNPSPWYVGFCLLGFSMFAADAETSFIEINRRAIVDHAQNLLLQERSYLDGLPFMERVILYSEDYAGTVVARRFEIQFESRSEVAESQDDQDRKTYEVIVATVSFDPDAATSGYEVSVQRHTATELVGAARLRHMIMDNDLSALERLAISKDIIDKPDARGDTPLLNALELGRISMALRLIEAGANVAVRGFRGKTPLHVAARHGALDVVEVILKQDDVQIVADDSGTTPLHLSSRLGHVDISNILLARGADPDAQDKSGRTPLYEAVGRGHVETAKVLIAAGADKAIRAQNGVSPVDLAERSGDQNLSTLFEER